MVGYGVINIEHVLVLSTQGCGLAANEVGAKP